MLDRIKAGEANSILVWKLDRLSRNPIDSGMIQYMLQKGSLSKVVTSDRIYYPVDSGLLYSVEAGMANQYIMDLSKNVKSGMQRSIEK